MSDHPSYQKQPPCRSRIPEPRSAITPASRELNFRPNIHSFKPRLTKRSFGATLMSFGSLALILSSYLSHKLDQKSSCIEADGHCKEWRKHKLLKNVRTGLIDPDTPAHAMTKKDFHGKTWNLVYSDEFSTPGRTFYEGDDPYWTAVDLEYQVTENLEWYDPDAITTKDGVLEIKFDKFESHGKDYRSGMLQSWNKMCFKGGRLEASVSLPGQGDTSGFWPGFWALGNLGRPGFPASTEGMWPWSYEDICDAGIIPYQGSDDGMCELKGMKLPACTCLGEDHPSPGRSRSAPEIDVFEAQVGYLDSGNQIGRISQGIQIAPLDIWWRPDYEYMEVYDHSITSVTEWIGSPFQESISMWTVLNNSWYDGNQYQTYAFEYTPGADGEIIWFVGKDATWRLTGKAIRPNGNVGQRIISEEPMSIIINNGMSWSFSWVNHTGIEKSFPATMRVDYVRIYQDEKGEITCDPEGWETTEYIQKHPNAYSDPSHWTWRDAGYAWPKNSLMDGCEDAKFNQL